MWSRLLQFGRSLTTSALVKMATPTPTPMSTPTPEAEKKETRDKCLSTIKSLVESDNLETEVWKDRILKLVTFLRTILTTSGLEEGLLEGLFPAENPEVVLEGIKLMDIWAQVLTTGNLHNVVSPSVKEWLVKSFQRLCRETVQAVPRELFGELMLVRKYGMGALPWDILSPIDFKIAKLCKTVHSELFFKDNPVLKVQYAKGCIVPPQLPPGQRPALQQSRITEGVGRLLAEAEALLETREDDESAQMHKIISIVRIVGEYREGKVKKADFIDWLLKEKFKGDTAFNAKMLLSTVIQIIATRLPNERQLTQNYPQNTLKLITTKFHEALPLNQVDVLVKNAPDMVGIRRHLEKHCGSKYTQSLDKKMRSRCKNNYEWQLMVNDPPEESQSEDFIELKIKKSANRKRKSTDSPGKKPSTRKSNGAANSKSENQTSTGENVPVLTLKEAVIRLNRVEMPKRRRTVSPGPSTPSTLSRSDTEFNSSMETQSSSSNESPSSTDTPSTEIDEITSQDVQKSQETPSSSSGQVEAQDQDQTGNDNLGETGESNMTTLEKSQETPSSSSGPIEAQDQTLNDNLDESGDLSRTTPIDNGQGLEEENEPISQNSAEEATVTLQQTSSNDSETAQLGNTGMDTNRRDAGTSTRESPVIPDLGLSDQNPPGIQKLEGPEIIDISEEIPPPEEDVKPSLASLRSMIPSPADRPMNYDEMGKLMMDILELKRRDRGKFEEIAEVIARCESTLKVEDWSHFEVGINELKANTLRELEVYVAVALRKKLPRLIFERTPRTTAPEDNC